MTNITSAYSKAFEQLVDGVIVANVGVVLAGRLVDGHETLLEMAHYAILAFFVMELAERLRANGWGFCAWRYASKPYCRNGVQPSRT